MGTRATLQKITKQTLTEDYIRQVSSELDLPYLKTSLALDVIMPSLFMAFAHHGRVIDPYLSGIDMLEILFDNELTNFATKLQHPSDLSLPGVISMMKLIAPKVAGIVKEEVGTEDVKARLKNETIALAEVVPTDISNHFNFGQSNPEMGEVSRFVTGTVKELTPYPKLHNTP